MFLNHECCTRSSSLWASFIDTTVQFFDSLETDNLHPIAHHLPASFGLDTNCVKTKQNRHESNIQHNRPLYCTNRVPIFVLFSFI